MKKTPLYIAAFGLSMASCDPCDGCEDIYTHSVAVRNQSEENFKILFYDSKVADPQTGSPPFLREEVIIGPGDAVVKNFEDVSDQPSYYSYSHIFSDSIVLKFDNGKGYYTTFKEQTISTDFWIQGKSSFFKIDESDLIEENGVLTFMVSQSDYDSANDLF